MLAEFAFPTAAALRSAVLYRCLSAPTQFQVSEEDVASILTLAGSCSVVARLIFCPNILAKYFVKRLGLPEQKGDGTQKTVSSVRSDFITWL